MAPIRFYKHLKVDMTQRGHVVDPPAHRGALHTAHSCEEQQSRRGAGNSKNPSRVWDDIWFAVLQETLMQFMSSSYLDSAARQENHNYSAHTYQLILLAIHACFLEQLVFFKSYNFITGC